jgi:glycosyltransferase involved in cell wall biosynthesis
VFIPNEHPHHLPDAGSSHLQRLLPVSRSFEHPTPMEGAASAQARDLGVAGQVIFTGRLEDAELVKHYRLATVFALPSEKEGFGIVFLVMMAFG